MNSRYAEIYEQYGPLVKSLRELELTYEVRKPILAPAGTPLRSLGYFVQELCVRRRSTEFERGLRPQSVAIDFLMEQNERVNPEALLAQSLVELCLLDEIAFSDVERFDLHDQWLELKMWQVECHQTDDHRHLYRLQDLSRFLGDERHTLMGTIIQCFERRVRFLKAQESTSYSNVVLLGPRLRFENAIAI